VPGEFDQEAFTARWRGLGTQNDLIVLAPQALRPRGWSPTEIEFVRKTLEQVINRYNIDRTRIVVHGYQASGTMAMIFAFRHRALVRGLVAVDATLPRNLRPPANDPVERLAIVLGSAEESKARVDVEELAELLSEMKYPVTRKPITGPSRPLNDDELSETARWIDTLDRI
jgi:predicted esterase